MEQLTAPDLPEREKSHRYPDVLPNGKGVLFTMGSAHIDTYDDARIEVLNLDTGERSVLIEGGTTPRYLPTGHIVYARNGSLLAVPFDQDRLVVTGTTMKVLDGVITSPDYGSAHVSLSEDGLLGFAPDGPLEDAIARLVWVNRNGEAEPIAGMEGCLARVSYLTSRRTDRAAAEYATT